MAGDGKPAHRVVIVGGGFGGLLAAKNLKKAPVEITLIDRRNFHLFQPLLYQVATGGLSPANIAAPLRSILRKQRNAKVVLGEVVGFDLSAKSVQLKDGTSVPFDSLILATGATHHYFGHDEWADFAPGLKTIEDATEIRRRILSAFEKAEREPDPAVRERLLTFVVVGGGPTGVEMAGAIRELAVKTMRYDFRAIDPASCRVILVEGQTRVLSMFHEKLSAKALTMLAKLGVTVMLDAHVTSVEPGVVVVKEDNPAPGAPAGPTRIETETIMWAAGVKASALGKLIADAVGGVELDRAGRVMVNPDCTVGNRPDVFVVGDMATMKGADGKPLPGVAPVAMQQGEYVAAAIRRRLNGESPGGAFKYFDKGSMATIGAAKAIAQTGRIRRSGFVAWLAWLFIHILYLARFENRMLVMFQWFWNYVTRNRTARLITGERAATTTAVNEVARAK
ncbi:MAG TPA: NAD(P)/FAD-dependent oxidoreductase [Gemmataceae bacterium]|nr:NAD(P)/FAD-dependent oxidoreductase [Gemmataceae bacterium]